MSKFSRVPEARKIKCFLNHKPTLVKQVEPIASKKINGYKLYKCSVCGEEYKKIISYRDGGEY